MDCRRLWENVYCKPHFSKFTVERLAPGNSVIFFTLNRVSGKLKLNNYSLGILSRFQLTNIFGDINNLYLYIKNTCWRIIGHFRVFCPNHLLQNAFHEILNSYTHFRVY